MIVEKVVLIMVVGKGMGVVIVCELVVIGYCVVLMLLLGSVVVFGEELGGFGI